MNIQRTPWSLVTFGRGGVLWLAASVASILLIHPQGTTQEHSDFADTSDAPSCTGHRWIAVSPSKECPSVSSSWTSSPVFSDAEAPGLAPYCVYEWREKDSRASAAEIAALRATLGEIEEDCGASVPLGNASKELRRWARRQFLDGVGALDPLPSGHPEKVRIAVADTSPPSEDGLAMGMDPHGSTMAAIARELSCPEGGPCTSHVVTELALPRSGGGGAFGTRLDLARSIYRAVETWKQHVSTEPRLVINLSAGWDPRDGCGEPSITLPATQRAVLAALEHASCHGALVIAAAGNDSSGGQDPTAIGATCPAAWSTHPAPTAAYCKTFESSDYARSLPPYPLFSDDSPSSPDAHAARPLLYAAGAVDYADRPLAVSRPFSSPPFAALGFQGVGGARDEDAVTPPLTGTSVAAAVLSGVAATVWGYRPELTASEIMDIVHRSGAALKRSADLLLPGVDSEVRRASLCEALMAGCFDGAAHPLCPSSLAACPVRPAMSADQNPAPSPDAIALLATEFAGANVYGVASAAEERPSIDGQPNRLSALARVEPQPTIPPCGACAFSTLSRTLSVEIDHTYPPILSLTQMKLTLTGPSVSNPNTNNSLVFEPQTPSPMNYQTPPFEVQNIDWSALTHVDTATLSWLVTDVTTGISQPVSEQILIQY